MFDESEHLPLLLLLLLRQVRALARPSKSPGQGRTLLIGTFPAAGYYLYHAAATRALFASFLPMAGLTQQVQISDPTVQARLHVSRTQSEAAYLWITNRTREPKAVHITLQHPAASALRTAQDMWGTTPITLTGHTLTLNIPPRDAVVAKLTN